MPEWLVVLLGVVRSLYTKALLLRTVYIIKELKSAFRHVLCCLIAFLHFTCLAADIFLSAWTLQIRIRTL